MKIGVLGSGDVGQVLGAGLVGSGHEVMLGTREPTSDKAKRWAAKLGSRAKVGTFAETANFADVAVLATLWSGTENAIWLADPKSLAGKVVMDATNPLEFRPNEPPRLAVGHLDSGGEQVQRWLPDARVVKAFNIVGNALMVKPELSGGPPDMFICGNDENAKTTVRGLCEGLGWPVIDIGGIEGARLLEPLAMLWITVGFRSGSWSHAFKLLGRSGS